MIGMIEAQGDENRPPIEKVIDRRATIFRNNQFGSQFDHIDIFGLKKQEEDKIKSELRQVQLRQTAMTTGSSMGGLVSSGFTTPAEVYDEMNDDNDDITSQDLIRIRAELDNYLQRQREAQEASVSSARSDLDEVESQSLPAGVDFYRMNTGGTEGTDDLPPLVDIPPEVRIQQPSSSSSGTLKDVFVSGAKAGVETLAKAGATAIAKSFVPV